MSKSLKYFKLIQILILSLFITVGTVIYSPVNIYADNTTTDVSSAVTWPTAPELVSKQTILMDADTGAILYEKDSKKRNYPASTTKILTGLLVAQNASLKDTITFSRAAAQSVGPDDSTLGMKEGEQITIQQAMAGLLLHSANEIAYGLAEYVSGSLPKFADQMNLFAKNAGCLDTHFVNASGLFDKNHYSTPYDMALIARTCFNNPTFLSIDSLTDYTIPPTNKTDEERVFTNRNLLLPGMYYEYEYCVGGKTGYLPEGGYTYVSYASKNGMRLIAVCFDSDEMERFNDAAKLFEWGFNNFKKVSLSGSILTASYSNLSYLSSSRFSSGDISRAFDSSYVTIPNTAQLSDVVLTNDQSHTVTNDENGLAIPVSFNIDKHVVATATLKYNSGDSTDSTTSLLPYANHTKKSPYKTQFAIVINIVILIAIGIGCLIVFLIVRHKKAAKAEEERKAKLKSQRQRKRKSL